MTGLIAACLAFAAAGDDAPRLDAAVPPGLHGLASPETPARDGGDDGPHGRLMVGVGFGPNLAVLRCGGRWTREAPFFVNLPVGCFSCLTVSVTLNDPVLKPDAPPAR